MEQRTGRRAEVRALKPLDEAVSRPLPHRTLYPIQRTLTYKDDGSGTEIRRGKA